MKFNLEYLHTLAHNKLGEFVTKFEIPEVYVTYSDESAIFWFKDVPNKTEAFEFGLSALAHVDNVALMYYTDNLPEEALLCYARGRWSK